MNNIVLCCVLSVFLFSCYTSAIVVGIDFGSQWYKIAMIKPGSFDIVLNEQSSRKTHTLVGWNRGERFFGSDAFNLLQRNPSQVYSYVTQLLGKKYDHPTVQVNADWLTYAIAEDANRNTISIKHDENTNFAPEELTAMILRRAKEIATAAANGSPVKDCVITVPPWLTHHERQAVIDAAELAGFNVLSLINDITAFALSYAKDRNFDNNTQNVIFYDIGSTGTKAALVTFQSIADVKAKKNKTIAQVLVRATAWDETLGGRFLDQQIANHFKKVISAKYPDVNLDNHKLTLRLLKEAAKAKEILSANQQTQAVLQGLGDHDDLLVTVTRKELEEMGEDFWERILNPIKAVIEEADIPKEEIGQIEIVGGTTRIPKIQSVLKEFLDRSELDKHVNGDEGAATGAAFFAAGLSSQFRVKEVRVRDLTTYPINVRINLGQEADVISTNSEDDQDKVDTDTSLFRQHSRLNTRKGLTFYTHSNFTLDLMYDQSEAKYATPKGSEAALMQIAVAEMPSHQKYNITGKPKAEINTIQYISKAKANVTIPASENQSEPSANEPSDVESENPEAGEAAKEGTDANEQTDEQPEKEEPASDAKTAEPEELEPVKRTHTIPLKATITYPGIKPVDSATRKTYENSLSHFDKLDTKRRELQQERNSLEAYVYETRDKLESGDVIEASTEDEREALSAELSAMGDWLMEHEDDATVHEYRAKLRSLKDRAEKIYFRIKEQTALPAAAEELRTTIKLANSVLQNITEVLNVTEEEKDRILKAVTTAEEWLKTKLVDQDAVPKSKDPVVTSDEVARKRTDIEQQMKLILRKPKRKPAADTTKATEPETTEAPEPETNTEIPENENEIDEEAPENEVDQETEQTVKDEL